MFGVSMMNVDYGDLQGTIRSSGDSGYEETGLFKPTASVFGLGYAFAPTDRLSVGGQVKFANEILGTARMDADGAEEDLDMSTTAFDFGLMYQMDWRNLLIARSARNFSESL